MASQDELEAARQAARALYDLHCATFPSVEGAASLIELYGDIPSFHDSEVLDLNLSRTGTSTIRVSNPYPDVFAQGRVIVLLEIRELIDLELDGFSPQNVLFGLYVSPLGDNPAREPYYARRRQDTDYRIELESTWGIGGVLICGGLKVAWTKDRKARNLPPPAPKTDLLGQ